MPKLPCETMRETLINQQNNLQIARSRFARLKEDKRDLQKRIQQLQGELSRINMQQFVSGTVDRLGKPGRILGPLMGLEGEIRKSRLEDELGRTKDKFLNIDREIDAAETEVRNYEGNIPTTLREMAILGCKP